MQPLTGPYVYGVNRRSKKFLLLSDTTLSEFFDFFQPDTLMRSHKKSERVVFLDKNKPQKCL